MDWWSGRRKKQKKKKGSMRVVRVLTKRETCLTPQKDMLYYEKDSVVLQIGWSNVHNIMAHFMNG